MYIKINRALLYGIFIARSQSKLARAMNTNNQRLGKIIKTCSCWIPVDIEEKLKKTFPQIPDSLYNEIVEYETQEEQLTLRAVRELYEREIRQGNGKLLQKCQI